MQNVVILTHGWSGSSMLSALLASVGGWPGDITMRKPDYDTFENQQLVELNERLLKLLAPNLDHEHRFDPEEVLEIERLAPQIDLRPWRNFVTDCEAHQPWVWKDPRLTWTIRVWSGLLDLDRTAFVILTREPAQAWITANLRRHVQSLAFTRAYNDGITQSNLRYLRDRGLKHVSLSFEDLLLRPEATLARLSELVDTTLTMAQLRSVCQLPLGRKSRGLKDLLMAALIYARNYNERDGRGRGVRRPPASSGAATTS